MMHGHEKSDSVIVAVKPTNKVEQPAAERFATKPTAAEPVEPRAETKGNADQQSTCRTQSWTIVSQALERIRKAAKVRNLHPWPSDRFAVRHPRWDRTSLPDALIRSPRRPGLATSVALRVRALSRLPDELKLCRL
jgi:hypothetical protein